MRIWIIRLTSLRGVLVEVIAIIGVIAMIIEFWDKLGAWSLVIGLGVLLIVLGYLFYRGSDTASVQFVCEVEEVPKKATKLLKETKRSLYYYGGAGLIGAYQHWR